MQNKYAVAWRLHSVLDSALWQRCECVVGAARVHFKDAV